MQQSLVTMCYVGKRMCAIRTSAQEGGPWVGCLPRCFFVGAMGDKLDNPPRVGWTNYTTGALLQTVQEILVELSARDQGVVQPNPEPGTTSEGAPGPATASAPVLQEPWSRGFRCKWCERPCTRNGGHVRHSCYYCRHRR